MTPVIQYNQFTKLKRIATIEGSLQIMAHSEEKLFCLFAFLIKNSVVRKLKTLGQFSVVSSLCLCNIVKSCRCFKQIQRDFKLNYLLQKSSVIGKKSPLQFRRTNSQR